MHNKDYTFLTTVSLGPSTLPLSYHHHEQIPKSTKLNKHVMVINHPVQEQHCSRDITDLQSHVHKRRQVNVKITFITEFTPISERAGRLK